MDALRATALTILIVGGLNWGLVGLFNYDLVSAIFGGTSNFAPSAASRVIYALVALSGLYALSFYRVGEPQGAEERAEQGGEE